MRAFPFSRPMIAAILLATGFNAPAFSQYYEGASADYVAPLSSTCVSNFWDPKFYGWWSFQNNCGQAIHLGFVAENGTGAFGGSGGSADIPAGGTKNIGQSPAEVNAAGGGYIMFVCPAGYVAVSANGGSLSATNARFRCKKW